MSNRLTTAPRNPLVKFAISSFDLTSSVGNIANPEILVAVAKHIQKFQTKLERDFENGLAAITLTDQPITVTGSDGNMIHTLNLTATPTVKSDSVTYSYSITYIRSESAQEIDDRVSIPPSN